MFWEDIATPEALIWSIHRLQQPQVGLLKTFRE
jgi:hypothetical protein